MSRSTDAKRPWDTLEYQRIATASFLGGEVIVDFADGTRARLSPQDLSSPDVSEPNWSQLRAEDFHLVVPSADGDIEIPWDVIRVHSDPEFDAFWAELAVDPVGSGAASRVNG